MVDIYAPIVPGESAAGIYLGENIDDVLARSGDTFSLHFSSSKMLNTNAQIYRSEDVDLWVENGVIVQITLHDRYQGRLMDAVGIGSVTNEIEDAGGRIVEANGTLMIEGVNGLSFEVDGDDHTYQIVEMVVFPV